MPKTRSNQEWLDELRSSGPVQEAALADLRDLLLRAALYYFSKNLGDFRGMNREEILQRAEDCAQDALIAVINRLSDFRGDSKFTTWAYKFAINRAMVTARHERWKSVSLDELAASDEINFLERLMQDKSDGAAPERSAIQTEVQKIIQDVIEHDLTEKQRQVFVLVSIHGVPLDEVVQYMGTNRNAVYKLLHESRRKLKDGLMTHGFDAIEMLTLFGPSKNNRG